MKIIGLSIKNLRKIHAAELDFDGKHFVELRGENEAGKSTVIDALEFALCGGKAIPPNVVTRGAKKATIIAKVGDFEVTRIIQTNGNTSLTIKKDGQKQAKPQEFLNRLSGEFIDPMKFAALSGREMRLRLMNYLGLDFTEIDKQFESATQDRLLIGREIKQFGTPEAVPEVKEKSVQELLNKRQSISAFNVTQQNRKAAIEEKRKEFLASQTEGNAIANQILEKEDAILREKQIANDQIEELKKKIEERQQLLKENTDAFIKQIKEDQQRLNENKVLSEKIQTEGKALSQPEELKPFDEIDVEISGVEEHNKKAAAFEKYVMDKTHLEKRQAEYDKHHEIIEELRDEKDKMVTSAGMPIEGLKITDSGLSFNGDSDDNWSDSQSIKIATYISAEFAKDLKIIYIDRGESLDSTSRKEIIEFAKAKEFLVIVGIVDESYDSKDENVIMIKEGKVFKESEASDGK